MKLSFRPLAAVVFAACAALVGCGPKPEPPEAVAEKVFKGLFVEQNFEAVKPFVSGDAVKGVEEFQARVSELQKEKRFKRLQWIRDDALESTVVEKTLGKSEATIVYGGRHSKGLFFHLTKDSDGFWKVDQIDEKEL